VPFELLTCPTGGGFFDLLPGDDSARCNVDSVRDDQKLSCRKLQRFASLSLSGTMIQKSPPGFRRRTILVPRQNAGMPD
jgi:hypothetical protein